MKIDFFIDPCCPFCWITSRWLVDVQAEREIDVTWKPFSLSLKNGELGNDDTSQKASSHNQSHRVLRVMQQAEAEHPGIIGDLYSRFGKQYFIDKKPYDNDTIAAVLSSANLPSSLIEKADDSDVDDVLQQSIDEAVSIAGEDIGVPTIVFHNDDGAKIGYFGPVLQTLPDKAAGLTLWDGLSQLAQDTNFYELKRSRPSGGPDVASTGKRFK